MVCVALPVQLPLRSPAVARDPPVPSVSVTACALPNTIFFTLTLVVIVGWLRKVAVPRSTISVEEGGLDPDPCRTVQLAAVFQSVLTLPFHCTRFELSESVHLFVI